MGDFVPAIPNPYALTRCDSLFPKTTWQFAFRSRGLAPVRSLAIFQGTASPYEPNRAEANAQYSAVKKEASTLGLEAFDGFFERNVGCWRQFVESDGRNLDAHVW